jgi:hypothetical protein
LFLLLLLPDQFELYLPVGLRLKEPISEESFNGGSIRLRKECLTLLIQPSLLSFHFMLMTNFFSSIINHIAKMTNQHQPVLHSETIHSTLEISCPPVLRLYRFRTLKEVPPPLGLSLILHIDPNWRPLAVGKKQPSCSLPYNFIPRKLLRAVRLNLNEYLFRVLLILLDKITTPFSLDLAKPRSQGSARSLADAAECSSLLEEGVVVTRFFVAHAILEPYGFIVSTQSTL